MFIRLIQHFKRERLGLTMIVASVAVIAVIIALLFVNQNRQELENLRQQGASIVNIMSGIPYEQLSDRGSLHGPLKVLALTLRPDNLAYAMVVDRNIDVHVRSIRKKIGAHRELIETIRGVGYRFREEP